MEELVTLQNGNFTILGDWAKEFTQRTSCSNRVASQTLRGQLFLSEPWWEHPGWNTSLQTRLGSLSADVPAPQHCLNEKRAPKVLPSTTSRDSQSNGPWATLHPHPFRVHRCRNTEYHQEGLLGECIVAPCVLPHQRHEECMTELHKELTKHMARAGIQSKPRLARPTARSRRHSHSCSTSLAFFSSAGPLGAESAKWLREDHSTRQEGSRSWCYLSGDRLRCHPSPLPWWLSSTSHSPLAPHDPICW